MPHLLLLDLQTGNQASQRKEKEIHNFLGNRNNVDKNSKNQDWSEWDTNNNIELGVLTPLKVNLWSMEET